MSDAYMCDDGVEMAGNILNRWDELNDSPANYAHEMARAVIALDEEVRRLRGRLDFHETAAKLPPLPTSVMATAAIAPFDLAAFFDAKAAWSRETFGPGDRYAGVVAHIRKELDEIEATPADPVEWVDVVLLAMDGAWRSAGMTGAGFVDWMRRKDEVNRLRTWPDWRTLKPGEVSEHVKPAPPSPGASGLPPRECMERELGGSGEFEPSEADVEAVAIVMHDAVEKEKRTFRRWDGMHETAQREQLVRAREAIRLGADPGRAG